MSYNKLFLDLFYKILSEQEISSPTAPVQVSQEPSALPKDIDDKTFEVDLLNLCKKCIYLNLETLSQKQKIDLVKLKSEPVTYSNAELVLTIIESLIIRMVPGYIKKFDSEYFKKHNVYNKKETLIDLLKLAKKCLFLETYPEGDSENPDRSFSSFLTNKIKDINNSNVDEARKTIEQICDEETV